MYNVPPHNLFYCMFLVCDSTSCYGCYETCESRQSTRQCWLPNKYVVVFRDILNIKTSYEQETNICTQYMLSQSLVTPLLDLLGDIP